MITTAIGTLPTWALIAAGAVVAASVASAVSLGWRRRWAAVAGVGWLAVALVILLVTLTPTGELTGRFCGTSWTPLPPSRWLSPSHDTLNIWMFTPLGLFAAALPRRWLPIAVALGFSLPVAIEAVQYLAPLGRSCQLDDIANNWLGLALGLIGGLAVRVAARKTSCSGRLKP